MWGNDVENHHSNYFRTNINIPFAYEIFSIIFFITIKYLVKSKITLPYNHVKEG